MADDEGGEMEEYWDEEGEDGEWDDAEGEWDDDDDWDDEDEEDDDDDYEGGVAQIRPQMGGRNRMPNCGIHTINIYYPQFYMKQIEMEEFDARPDRYGPSVIGKYTKGIGQIEGRYPTDDEDPVSYSMTNIHRFIERMEKEGFNETYKYSEDGKSLKPWNSIGRLDIGSESLVDRSKSMKAYCMDLFERYGDMEANIEGVDMYNACYGGQAAGLCAQNWVESDRWDGRYGVAIATDISEADYFAMFCVGAACTLTLYYPDAPLPHHSHRASCIMHRFDFFKPVGWFHIGPVVDGKYSIDAYMSCVDICYQTLRKKMNDRPLLQISDYNVFHTGGGWHIVKKAFERCMRAENPKMLNDERERYIQEKLLMSANLLKIIGPCHTVSSFLNISSCIMSQWEQALGKVLVVFTYGSGCASSMYQLRFDDIPWYPPLAEWKVQFYRHAIYQHPSTMIHQFFVETWMKFGYVPMGRKVMGIDPWLTGLDVYYLMEIDKWGRRWFHLDGILGKPMDKKWALRVDQAEGRFKRERWGPLPEKPTFGEKSLENKWKEIEFDLTFDDTGAPEPEVLQDAYETHKPGHKIVIIEEKSGPMPNGRTIDNDNQQHNYQIVGSWSNWKELEEMEEDGGMWQYTVTLGENMWEEFHLVQDKDRSKKIYPASMKSWKSMPCVGPHHDDKGKHWRIDGRDLDETPEEDVGKPGDLYIVSFSWRRGELKNLEWDKLEGESGEYPVGSYFIFGTWTCWEFEPMQDQGSGTWTAEATLTWLGLEFGLSRNKDYAQILGPEVPVDEDALAPLETGKSGSVVVGPDTLGDKASRWSIQGNLGDVYSITFYRNPVEMQEVELTWTKLRSGPPVEPEPRYFMMDEITGWGAQGFTEFKQVGKHYTAEIKLKAQQTPFVILLFKRGDKCIHPDKELCSQQQAHKVVGPDTFDSKLCWAIGKSPADKAKVGDTFLVSYDTVAMKVSWKRK